MSADLPSRHKETGSLGSDLIVVRGTDSPAFRDAIEELSADFRKCWYHLPAGLAVFMATSRAHEIAANEASDLVKALCHASGLAVVSLRSTTAQTEDRCHSVDPDESFLVGERAERFRRIERNAGSDAALEDLGGQPQDLAIEVERGPHDDVRAATRRFSCTWKTVM